MVAEPGLIHQTPISSATVRNGGNAAEWGRYSGASRSGTEACWDERDPGLHGDDARRTAYAVTAIPAAAAAAAAAAASCYGRSISSDGTTAYAVPPSHAALRR